MVKYKINVIFNNENNIDDILIKTLKQELKKYINNNCNYLSHDKGVK